MDLFNGLISPPNSHRAIGAAGRSAASRHTSSFCQDTPMKQHSAFYPATTVERVRRNVRDTAWGAAAAEEI